MAHAVEVTVTTWNADRTMQNKVMVECDTPIEMSYTDTENTSTVLELTTDKGKKTLAIFNGEWAYALFKS